MEVYLGILALPSAHFLRTGNLLESVNVTSHEPACWRFGSFRIRLLSADKKRKPEKATDKRGQPDGHVRRSRALTFRRRVKPVHVLKHKSQNRQRRLLKRQKPARQNEISVELRRRFRSNAIGASPSEARDRKS